MMDLTTRLALESLYRVLLSAVVLLAQALGKECPIVTRDMQRRLQALDKGSILVNK